MKIDRKYFGSILLISLIINVLCIPLAGIYIVRKVQFYESLQKVSKGSGINLFDAIRRTQFDKLIVDTNSIVFLGDSYTQNFEVSEFFNNLAVKNRGIILDGTPAVLNRINQITKGRPKKVFILIGINDLLAGLTPSTTLSYLSKILDNIKNNSPKTIIYVQSLIPTTLGAYETNKPLLPSINEFNKGANSLCKSRGLIFIDLYKLFIKGNGLNPDYDAGDHLHLNGAGYLLWANSIKKYVSKP